MAEVTAKLVQELREKTSAGMMDCKKALVENNGDIEAAADWLRQKGIVPRHCHDYLLWTECRQHLPLMDSRATRENDEGGKARE